MFSPPRHNGVDASNRREALTRLSEQLEKPPRHVALSLMGKIGAASLAFFLVILIWSFLPLIRNGWRIDPVDLVFLVGMVVVALPTVLKMTARSMWQHELLKSGACSVGSVVFEQKTGGGLLKRTRIVFEFPVGGHKPMTGQGSDWTKSYKMNTPVLVFYDPSDISKYVAICSTAWRVRTALRVLVEP